MILEQLGWIFRLLQNQWWLCSFEATSSRQHPVKLTATFHFHGALEWRRRAFSNLLRSGLYYFRFAVFISHVNDFAWARDISRLSSFRIWLLELLNLSSRGQSPFSDEVKTPSSLLLFQHLSISSAKPLEKVAMRRDLADFPWLHDWLQWAV